MKTPSFFLITILVFLFSACSNDLPVITTLEATPSEVFTGEETVLLCEAQSSSGKQVKYKWIFSDGGIFGNIHSKSITWIAPKEPGAYELSIEVSEGSKTTIGKLTINVVVNNIQYFTIVDSRDGRNYSYFNYRGQAWMAENLAFLPYVNSGVEESLYEAKYYVYNYQGDNLSEAKLQDNYLNYGVLYNWAAALSACPDGWRLPNDEDWKELEMKLGMTEDESNEVNWRDSGDVGRLIKSKEGWARQGNGFNRIGFSALPAGYRAVGNKSVFIQNKAWFWTATTESFDGAWYRNLSFANKGIYRYHHTRDHACSVRCIKAD